MGDSKTANGGWQTVLQNATGIPIGNAGIGGATVASYRSGLAATVAGVNELYKGPKYVLLNLGINDIATGTPIDAAWEANYEGLIDDIRAYWPNTIVYVAYPWGGAYDAACASMHPHIDNVIAARANVFAGPDEAVIMKGSDFGATNYGADLIHYSTAGKTTWGLAWAGVVPH